MLLLGIDTSTSLGSVAILKDNQIVAAQRSMRQRSHSEWIAQAVETCLQKAQCELNDVEAFCVGEGPGSFTGLRISSSLVKTWAYLYKKPIFAMDTLECLACGVDPSQNLPILTIVNAFKNQVFFNYYIKKENHFEPKYEVCALEISQIEKYVSEKSLCVGDAYSVFEGVFSSGLKSKLTRDSQYSDFPLAETLVRCVGLKSGNYKTFEWNSFLPLYIKASEAEERLREGGNVYVRERAAKD